MKHTLDEALEACLQRVGTGVPANVAVQDYPELGDELAPLLEMTLAVQTLPTEPLSTSEHKMIRDALQAERSRMDGAGSRPKRARGLLTVASLAATVTLMLFGTYVSSVSLGSLPGDRLYPFKIGAEQLRLGLTLSTESQAREVEQMALRRLDEAVQLQARGDDPQPALAALAALELELASDPELARAFASRKARLVSLWASENPKLAPIISGLPATPVVRRTPAGLTLLNNITPAPATDGAPVSTQVPAASELLFTPATEEPWPSPTIAASTAQPTLVPKPSEPPQEPTHQAPPEVPTDRPTDSPTEPSPTLPPASPTVFPSPTAIPSATASPVPSSGISGRVLDESGLPLGDVLIKAYRASDMNGGFTLISTEPDGSYQLFVEPDIYKVEATHPGYATQWFDDAPDADSAMAVEVQVGTIEGDVDFILVADNPLLQLP